MKNTRLSFLFQRYVNKTCSDQERQEFFDLVADAAHDEEVKALLASLWSEYEEVPFERSRAVYDTIFAKQSRRTFPWLKVAAAFLMLAVVGASLLFLKDDQTAQPAEKVAVRNVNPDFVVLPDGSTVILNAGSRLTYDAAFGGPRREVTLEGEGYFDIVHDATRPFIVHTGKLRTTVLGTAFNIKAYSGQEEITVTVTRGRVQVSNDQETFGIIAPDQQITFDRNRGEARQGVVDSHSTRAWVEKDIFFDDVTLAEAVGQLEKRFDADIHVGNEQINQCRFTATFVKGEDLEQIVRIICEFNQATYEKDGAGGYRITGGVCL